jgi:ABC-type multidrug transport system fused ATPase/permease subunit
MIANLLIFVTTVTAVLMRSRLTAGTVGLMITYAMQVTNSLNMLVRVTSEIETNIVSVERINEYAELTPEAAWEIPERKPPTHWPTNGSIQYVGYRICLETLIFIFSRITDLSARYRANLQLVLKDLTINILPGEKVNHTL